MRPLLRLGCRCRLSRCRIGAVDVGSRRCRDRTGWDEAIVLDLSGKPRVDRRHRCRGNLADGLFGDGGTRCLRRNRLARVDKGIKGCRLGVAARRLGNHGRETRLLLAGRLDHRQRRRCRLAGIGDTARHHHRLGIDTGRNHGNANLAGQLLIESRAEDDVGFGVHFLANPIGGLVNLEQRHIHAAGDIDQDAACALHRHVVEQRVRDRGLRGLKRPILTLGLTGAHHRLAHLAHHGANIGEVEVDQAGHHHQVGHAAHARMQNIVRHLEGVGECGPLRRDPEQVLVGDDEQGIDEFLQLFDARVGESHTMRSFEMERLRDHAYG